ncbi:MAG: DNA polymerase III subunit alpha [Acidaminococcaceae bacterium]|nr:DNA polymerase III subunit alpha [Acidaminococcaceae bacterium]
MTESFVHLHVHTKYSLLDGASDITSLVSYAKEMGMPALAITDHGVMYGVIEFYKECIKQGIKPIIGCEVYITSGSRFDKGVKVRDKQYHLILLAENYEGYKNLMKLVSIGQLEGMYYKPRIDKEVLRQYSKGLICLSACVAGEVQKHILRGEMETAERVMLEYLEIFDREHYFLEIQNHDLPEEKIVAAKLREFAVKYNIGLVATNDLHYVHRADAAGQDILLCIQTNARYSDPNRMRFNNDMYYLKSRKEMEERFPEDIEALNNTLKIAERCNLKLEFGHLLLPKFPLPKGTTGMEYLRKLCKDGFASRYSTTDKTAIDRLEYELGIIEQMGYPGYFLIVWDFINYCRNNDIPVGPGRGSAAGSIVAYLTGITNIDPLKYDLIFERFLNPERVSMPDIDTDICYVKRHLVVDYLAKKYGETHVAQIITFGTLAAKAAVKDVGRALDVPLSTVNQVNKMIPNIPGTTLKDALKNSKELRALCESDAAIAQMLDFAKKVEGMPRHTSTHAAGVVITPEELTNYVPLQITSSSDDEHEYVCTQYDKDRAESLGLLKMDLLGLRTLTVIDDAVKMLKKNRNIVVDVDKLDLEDKKTCAMLCRGDTAAVFQMESDGMTQLMRDLAPEGFVDLIPLVALYRPGPLGSGMATDFIKGRHGQRTAKALHPLLEPVIADTYGVILYQEQVMQITSVLGGFSLGEADILRRAMGKKKAKELDSMREKFIAGAKTHHNIDRALAEEVFALLQHFAGYGFNKSHSAAYALVAYQTAYLKANYPVEYMAAFLNSIIGNAEKVSWYINICRSMEIEVLPPDVNASESNFGVDGKAIRFGMAGIKSVGDSAVNSILEERTKNGPYKDFVDFTQRIDASKVNKRVVENLIKSGSMDGFGAKRSQLLAVMERALELAASRQKDRMSGQLGLFGEEEFEEVNSIALPDVAEMPKDEILRLEKELIGFYVTGHPLDAFRSSLNKLTPIKDLDQGQFGEGQRVTVGGIIAENKIRTTKTGDNMATFTLEDFSGSLTCIAFPRSYTANAGNIFQENIVKVQGILKLDEEEPRIFANTIMKLEKTVEDVRIFVAADKEKPEIQKQMAEIFAKYRGLNPVYLHLLGSRKIVKTDSRFWVKATDPGFIADIKALLGENTLR